MRRWRSISLCMERRSMSGASASESVSVLERRPRLPGPRAFRRGTEALGMLVGGMRRFLAAGRGVCCGEYMMSWDEDDREYESRDCVVPGKG